MTDPALSPRILFLLLALFLPALAEQPRKEPHTLENDRLRLYSERVINIHQPVYNPGYGNYQTVKPLHLTPPPPVIMENTIPEPTPIYNSREVKIKNRVNVIKHPMQFTNPFNYYQFPRLYNPYAGQSHPYNVYHPNNMLYGPMQYQAVGSLGLPFGSEGQLPKLSNDLTIPYSLKAMYGIRDKTNPTRGLMGGEQLYPQNDMAIERTDSRIGNFMPSGLGFDQSANSEFNPFSTQMGPFGPNSAYSMSSERQLRDGSTGDKDGLI